MPENLQYQEMINQYPILADFFPANEVAQLLGDRRLRSPEEKIEMFGGIEQVGTNIRLAQERHSEVPYIILLACDKDPMVPYEIVRFTYMATSGKYMLATPTLQKAINDCLGEGFLKSVPDISRVHRLKRGEYTVTVNDTGYSLTGGKAIEQRVALLSSQDVETSKLIPQPRPI